MSEVKSCFGCKHLLSENIKVSTSGTTSGVYKCLVKTPIVVTVGNWGFPKTQHKTPLACDKYIREW